jgi:hypothetical protein
MLRHDAPKMGSCWASRVYFQSKAISTAVGGCMRETNDGALSDLSPVCQCDTYIWDLRLSKPQSQAS